jgi:uncharacterized protein with FMN-binding domain
MRRAVPVLVATVLGLGLLANFHTSPGPAAVVATDRAAPGGGPAASPPPTTSAPAGSSPPAGRAAGGQRAVDGPSVPNRYGPVQVRVVLNGSRIVDVQPLALPTDRRRSAEISNAAVPTLRQEALRAQSAAIDTVSGATYTSAGYRQSLQAALDAAGVR